MAGIARGLPPLARRRWAVFLAAAAAVLCLWLAAGQGVFATHLYHGFGVTSYDYLSNQLSFSWTVPTSIASTNCFGSRGTQLYQDSVSQGKVGTCNITGFDISRVTLSRTGSASSFHINTLSSGTTANSDSYSFTPPDAVDITSATYSASTGDITVSWTADDTELAAETGTVYWHYYATVTSEASALTSAVYGSLATGSSVRSAAIDTDDGLVYTAGQELHLWVYATTDDLQTETDYDDAVDNSHYLTFSEPEALTIGSLSGCASGDIIDLGYLYGYGFDVTGTLDATACSVDAGVATGYGDTSEVPANVYRFRLATARVATLTLTPVTPFRADGGEYRFRLRSDSLDGNIVSEAAGTGNINGSGSLGGGLSYVLEVMRYGVGGSYVYSIAISYGHIEAPTPTPLPTPTPRVQPNLDFRLHPDPAGIGYVAGATYSFEFEGPDRYPVTVRSVNPAALELSLSSLVVCDTTAEDELEADGPDDVLYVKACTAGRNTTLRVIAEGGGLLAEYPIFVRGGPVPTPGPAGVSQGVGEDVSKRDLLGVGIILSVVCGGFGVGCDTDLITNLLVTVAAVAVMAFLLRRSRGGATSMSVGVAAAFALVALMLGYLWLGFPLWLVGTVLTAVLAVGGLAAVVKFRQVA